MPSIASVRKATLIVGLQLALAFEPTYLADSDAAEQHDYLRRKPVCSTLGDAADTQPVPKVVHQMWWQGETDLPAEYTPLRESWVAAHPDWTVKLWDAESATALVNESYPWFAPTFHALPSKIQKADAARYAILHAEGGVYADLDVEAMHALDDVLAPLGAMPTAHLFEEPATHWTAHNTVVSNGLMAAPAQHSLPLALLRSIRPVAAVFASGGSFSVQAALERCHAEEKEAAETAGVAMGGTLAGTPPCGCYVTHSSANFFPLHPAMRIANEFDRVGEHADAARNLIEELAAGSWPESNAYTVQHYTGSWIDAERGVLWLRGLAAARAKETEAAEKALLAVVWSKWGHRFKYANAPDQPDADRAKGAYERALHWWPEYGFALYELGNLALEKAATEAEGSGAAKAELAAAVDHFTQAVSLVPDSILFVNNLGVSLLNSGMAEEALAHFRKVLQLCAAGSFATVKGLDPEAGAHLNLGHALHLLGRSSEAHDHWLSALATGNYEHAVQATQRLMADEAHDMLPPSAVLDLTFGEALAKEGRTKEAALRFAAAHVGAANVTDIDGALSAERIRQVSVARMASLAEVWDAGEGALTDVPAARPRPSGSSGGGGANGSGGDAPVQVVQASADGTMKKMEMSQEEMVRMIKASQGK